MGMSRAGSRGREQQGCQSAVQAPAGRGEKEGSRVISNVECVGRVWVGQHGMRQHNTHR